MWTNAFGHICSAFANVCRVGREWVNVWRPVYTCEPYAKQMVCEQFTLDAWPINFKWIWGEHRTPDAPNSLCVHTKNWQISVCDERYANYSQMVQHRRSQSHPHIRAFGLQIIREWMCVPALIIFRTNPEQMCTWLILQKVSIFISQTWFNWELIKYEIIFLMMC